MKFNYSFVVSAVRRDKDYDLKVVEEIVGQLNLEKLLPCFKQTVTISSLRGIRRLQRCGHIRPDPNFFRSYAAPGQFIGTNS
jgi:hypothetical protein